MSILPIIMVLANSGAVCPEGKRCAVKYLFEGPVDEESTTKAIDFIDQANENDAKEIIFEINSPGGSVGRGFLLAKAIENSHAPVTCIVDGDAASMAAYILQSCTKRLVTKRSVIMFHEPSLSGMVEGQPNIWRAIAEMMEAERQAIAEHCQHRLKVSMEEYRKRTDGGLMWFLNWQDALKYGAVDGVIKSVKSEYQRALKRAS